MKLRPYQQEVAKAVMDSIWQGKGLTFSVEMARQGGKNELSAHLELLLLTLFMAQGGNIIKCSPTFKPQSIISMRRLKERLEEFGFESIYHAEMGYILTLGNARVIFLSAEESSSVVGHSADILLEVDESQDISKEKYSKDFRPMGSVHNVTTVHYGTSWDGSTLLEEVKQSNLELERKDGIKRHFRYDWREIGKWNAEYLKFVQEERKRLGEGHPLFRTQYALLPINGAGAFLSRQQIVLMQGGHSRLKFPAQGAQYIAGIDLAGEREVSNLESQVMRPRAGERQLGSHSQDSSVITVAEVFTQQRPLLAKSEPAIKVVEHFHWRGVPHAELYPQMVDIIKRWRCQKVVVDATGMGQPVASFLRAQLGKKVISFVFTQRSKSDLGFEVLSFINSGRLKLYHQDGSEEHRELMWELEHAKVQYRPNQTMSFFVDPSEGHDDFLSSLALLVQAARDFKPRIAAGRSRYD